MRLLPIWRRRKAGGKPQELQAFLEYCEDWVLSRQLHATTYLVSTLVLLCAAVGCHRGPKTPPLAKTNGTVTLDGKPVTTGIIVFVPDVKKGTSGPIGIGAMDRNGRYTIFTNGVDGAIVGAHNVRVQEPMGQSWIVPARYADAASSGLTAEVKSGQDNSIDFKLTTKP